MCCGKTTRHFTIQFIRLSNLESCLHKRFVPLARTTSKAIQKRADFYVKMECDQSKTIVFEALSDRECLFHEGERKEKAGKGYFENVST